jgi:hypothetical protein
MSRLNTLVEVYGRAQTKDVYGEDAIGMHLYNTSDPDGPPLDLQEVWKECPLNMQSTTPTNQMSTSCIWEHSWKSNFIHCVNSHTLVNFTNSIINFKVHKNIQNKLFLFFVFNRLIHIEFLVLKSQCLPATVGRKVWYNFKLSAQPPIFHIAALCEYIAGCNIVQPPQIFIKYHVIVYFNIFMDFHSLKWRNKRSITLFGRKKWREGTPHGLNRYPVASKTLDTSCVTLQKKGKK